MATTKTESKSEAAFGSSLGLTRDELLEHVPVDGHRARR